MYSGQIQEGAVDHPLRCIEIFKKNRCVLARLHLAAQSLAPSIYCEKVSASGGRSQREKEEYMLKYRSCRRELISSLPESSTDIFFWRPRLDDG
jgi:hypothetical protein